MSMSDHTRLWHYVERFFVRHAQTEWPTVARCARALGWTQARVEAAAEGDPDGRTMLTRFFTDADPPLGDYFVESVESRELPCSAP